MAHSDGLIALAVASVGHVDALHRARSWFSRACSTFLSRGGGMCSSGSRNFQAGALCCLVDKQM